MKFMEKNGPRMSICIIKTRTCRSNLQVESDENESFFSVFDLARRRCVACTEIDFFFRLARHNNELIRKLT